MKRFLLIFTLTFSLLLSRADEGMWIPLLLEQLNENPNAVGYLDPEVDITDEVIKELNK